MQTPADITGTTSFADLRRLLYENGEPFYSVAQCDLFLRVAGILRDRIPEEADHSGERLRTRDIDIAMKEARKAKGVLQLCAQPAEVLAPGPLREGY